MPDYHRYYLEGFPIFITCVTRDRTPLFRDPRNTHLFWSVSERVKTIHPFELIAFVLMPDHFHWIIKMPEGLPNFSQVIHSLKRNYSVEFKKEHKIDSAVSLWQPRFWDHILRDERDFEVHLDYIHWNPVKHRFVADPEQWEESSFRTFVKNGYYSEYGFPPNRSASSEKLNFE